MDRAYKVYHTLPPPDLYQNRYPLWDEENIDRHDAERAPSTAERHGVSSAS